MERMVGVDERIRRAEELYNRRKMQGGVRVSTNTVNNSSRNSLSLFKKMIIKIIVCAIIYLIFYILKNSGLFFSKNIIDQTKKIVSYDVDFTRMYSQAVRIFNENIIANVKQDGDGNQSKEQQNKEEEDNGDSKIGKISNIIDLDSDEITQNKQKDDAEVIEKLGVGGTDSNNEDLETAITDSAQVAIIQKTQMEIDAEYVKSNYSFTIPVQGIITSRFGPRQPTEIVTADHKGIDIGANTGTNIYASMEGTVISVSNYGDYGKHFSIMNGDVITLYAHCSKVNVNVGQFVKQGQQIAKVGSTGRTTGPHLHFEIKRDGRVINPEYILEF